MGHNICVKVKTISFFVIISFFVLIHSLYPQSEGKPSILLAQANGMEEFRWGVKAFNQGLFSKAIYSFEKSLSFDSSSDLCREWLARAYYKAGIESTAEDLLSGLIEGGYRSSNLGNKLEIIKSRNGFSSALSPEKKWVTEREIYGMADNKYIFFRRPSSVVPLDDGDLLVVSYGTNEVLRFDINGDLRTRMRGGMQFLDHPYDIVKIDDDLFAVSEFRGNRIAVVDTNGSVVRSIGEKGSMPGQLIGPQYLACDKSYIYVSDWGNSRICKFSLEGAFILEFGKPSEGYEGLKAPAGIVISGDRVFVSDMQRKCIDVFDKSGNFIKTAGKEVFEQIEGISLIGPDKLLVADSGRIVFFDIESETVEDVVGDFGEKEKIVSVKMDANGGMVAADFNSSKVIYISDMADIYGGLFVQLNGIDADRFPTVRVAVDVQDRLGNPIVGLQDSNFRISEDGIFPEERSLIFQGYKSGRYDIAVVCEDSVFMNDKKQPLISAVSDIFDILGPSSKLNFIVSGETASLAANPGESKKSVLNMLIKKDAGENVLYGEVVESVSINRTVRTGEAVRLAGTRIAQSVEKKAVIYIQSGKMVENDFSNYDLAETMMFLKNNGIAFYYIYLEPDGTSGELDYLCDKTGGKSYYYYGPEGIGGIVKDMNGRKNGAYVLEYESNIFDNYGQQYIPVRVEVSYGKKSGRDDLGYYSSSAEY